MKYNERGEELPDDTPIELPLKFKRPPTLQDQIKAMVRSEISRQAEEQGFESFDEADDFDVGDGEEVLSPHELTMMQEDAMLPVRGNSPADKEQVDGTVEGVARVQGDHGAKGFGGERSGAGSGVAVGVGDASVAAVKAAG